MMRNEFLLAACGLTLLASCSKAPGPASDAAAAEPAAVVEGRFDASATPAGVYKTDPKHAYIAFSYDHQGYSHPIIRWGEWSADLNWNPAAPEKSSVAATINVASVDTGVAQLDQHMQSADMFDAATYPTITFKSTGLTLAGGSSATMTGDLTIKDVTKPVTLNVTINKAADDAFAKGYKLGFSAKGALKRSDFGVDLYVPMVGDDVSITIEAEFLMPKDAATPQ
jgi:polyisoprenoid-binding protein YceI